MKDQMNKNEIKKTTKDLSNLKTLTERLQYCEKKLRDNKEGVTILRIPESMYKSHIEPLISKNEIGYNTFMNDFCQRKYFEGFLKTEFEKELSKAKDREFVINEALNNVNQFITTYGTEVIKQYKRGTINEAHHSLYSNEIECLGRFVYYLPYLENLLKTESDQKDNKNDKKQSEKNYSHKQIVIAYEIMKIPITTTNAKEILSKHSQTISVERFLSKRGYKPSELAKLSGNKSTDTKHLQDLEAAKRLVSGMKNKNAVTDIGYIIAAFQTAFNSKY